MKRGFLNLFGLMLAVNIANSEKGMDAFMPKIVNSGLSGWTGFTGSNANKKKHFNKKTHGRMLKRKHTRCC